MSDLLPTVHAHDCNLRRYHETGIARYLNQWDVAREKCERCAGLNALLVAAHERNIARAKR